jgi:hypothetical protein
MSKFNADIASIENRLDTLSSNHLLARDLTKLIYIKGLIGKVSQKNHSLAASLIKKADKALTELETSIEDQRNNAQEQLNIIEETCEHSHDQAVALFESKSYLALANLLNAIQKKESAHSFKGLINEMAGIELGDSSTDQPPKALSIATSKLNQPELQSFKQYQTLFEQMALDRLLARVMKEIPENAGPLNPERLVIRSFKALQAISPDYLNHLIAYYESLLTLQLVNASDK